MVTGATYDKKLLFVGQDRLDYLQSALFSHIENFGWELEAWAILGNHYHFVANSPTNTRNLDVMIMALHSCTAIHVNALDGQEGRRVWYQYWDTCLTYTRSYYPRLHYVHNNPCHHGLVRNAADYPWCSMGWFERLASLPFRRTVFAFKYDSLKIPDDF